MLHNSKKFQDPYLVEDKGEFALILCNQNEIPIRYHQHHSSNTSLHVQRSIFLIQTKLSSVMDFMEYFVSLIIMHCQSTTVFILRATLKLARVSSKQDITNRLLSYVEATSNINYSLLARSMWHNLKPDLLHLEGHAYISYIF